MLNAILPVATPVNMDRIQLVFCIIIRLFSRVLSGK